MDMKSVDVKKSLVFPRGISVTAGVPRPFPRRDSQKTRHLFDDERIDHASLALCLTSRHFLSLAQPTLYRAPFLAGRRRVYRFAQTLRDNPQLAKHVIHLAITDVAHPSRESQMEGAAVEDEGGDGSGSSVEILPAFAFAFPATRQGRLDRLQMLAQWMETRANAINAFRVAFLHILEQTAPQLRSLAILFYLIYDRNSDSGLSNGLSLPYPQLTELTVREEFLSLSWPSLQMPSLQDLQIAGGNPPYPHGLFEVLPDGCLQLTRLRLSEPFIDEEVASELKKIFLHEGTCAKGERRADMIGQPLPSLKIVLQPCLLRASRPQSLDVMECLREIEARVDMFELREPSDRSSDRYPFAEAASEWDARLQSCSEGT
ncbi:hypothetical protein SCHPADRAFT_693044 [Schizopora paradoxa]|uniref:Uncharacterized protein n=1 Tax=Schizopora paradoxa TaxID=27342 RepID=A0A0H2RNC5_9AGAM|nr:hypothetical protein SCHPADRAFT_693044 [Schizopora paradoxa]